MNKRRNLLDSFLCIAVLLAVFHSVTIFAAEMPKKPKRYTLSLCAIFKNEQHFLKEWIEYHRLIGVDHFYLYNNGSTDRSQEILNPYVREGLVTLIYWPDHIGPVNDQNLFLWALGAQVTAYENAIKLRAGKESKWLAILNIDEFLVPPETATLAETLQKYDDYPGVTLVTDYFDASKIDVLPRKKLLIQTLELTHAPAENVQKTVSKTIFKPDLCQQFTWPPYKVVFQNGEQAAILRKGELRINRYTNRNIDYYHFRKSKNKAHVDNRTLTQEQLSELLEEGYEVEDQEKAILQFVPDLLERMGFDRGWPQT